MTSRGSLLLLYHWRFSCNRHGGLKGIHRPLISHMPSWTFLVKLGSLRGHAWGVLVPPSTVHLTTLSEGVAFFDLIIQRLFTLMLACIWLIFRLIGWKIRRGRRKFLKHRLLYVWLERTFILLSFILYILLISGCFLLVLLSISVQVIKDLRSIDWKFGFVRITVVNLWPKGALFGLFFFNYLLILFVFLLNQLSFLDEVVLVAERKVVRGEFRFDLIHVLGC